MSLPPLVTAPTNQLRLVPAYSRPRTGDALGSEERASTAHEPVEPFTPSRHNGDGGPLPSSFRTNGFDATAHIDATEFFTAAHIPSHIQSNAHGEPQPSTSEKLRFGQRAKSFVRDKLHRAAPSRDALNQTEKTKLSSKAALEEPMHVSTNSVDVQYNGRRFSAFTLSGRHTSKSSDSASPPAPASPTGSISLGQSQNDMRSVYKHSASSTALSSMTKEKETPQVKWAGHGPGREAKRHTWSRRRSASTEQVPQIDSGERKPTTDLMATYSKPAARGVGMRSRRLSLSLPDEFVVDSCHLDKEFKSSSLMPGKRGKILGKGATSEVRIMARKGFGKSEDLVAVKEFRAKDRDESEADYIGKIKSEYSIAKSLHHPNIVETVRLCTNRGRWNHVMEYCAYGELYSLVERKLFSGTVEGYYSPNDRLCFFKQLLRGVQYLHSHGIAHRDIKLENLLLNKEGHLKISDFGVAEVFCGEHPGLRRARGECGRNMGEIRLSDPGICGSLPYIAPEVLDKRGPYDPRLLDVWSCAIVYLTMTFGGNPWQAARPDFPYYARFKKGWDEWLPTHPEGEVSVDDHPRCGKLFSLISPPPIKRLMLKMLHPNPDKRIMMNEVVDTASVRNIDCCCPDGYEDPKCCIDASKPSSSTASPQKRYLHHHIPPKRENKLGKVLHSRFDQVDSY